MSEHDSAGRHLDATSRDAERLIEARIEELRAVALGDDAPPTAGADEGYLMAAPDRPTRTDDPMAAVMRPVNPHQGRGSWESAPQAASWQPPREEPATAPRTQAPAPTYRAPAPQPARRPVEPVPADHWSEEPATRAAHAPLTGTAAALARLAGTADRSVVEQLASLITASAERVEFAVQEDVSRLEELLRQWGQPSEPVLSSLQRVERALRSELARLLEAVHTVPLSERQVAELIALTSQEAEERTADRFEQVRAEVSRLVGGLEAHADELSRSASSAAAVAGAGIGDRVSRQVMDLSNALIERVASLDEQVTAFAQLLGTGSHEAFSQRVETLEGTLDTRLGSLEGTLDGKLGSLEGTVDGKLGSLESSFAQRAAQLEAALVERADLLDDKVSESIAGLAEVIASDLDTLDTIADGVGRVADAATRMEDLAQHGYEASVEARAAIEGLRSATELAADAAQAAPEAARAAVEASATRASQQLAGQVEESLQRAVTSINQRTDQVTGAVDSSVERAMADLTTRVEGLLGEARAAIEALPTPEGGDVLAGRVAEQVSGELTSQVGDRVSAQLAESSAELRTWLDERLAASEETLLVAQDDVPEELVERVGTMVGDLKQHVDGLITTTNTTVSSALDGVTGVLESLREAPKLPDGWQQAVVGQLAGAVRESVAAELDAYRAAQEERLAQIHREFIGELDFNRLKSTQDHEGLIDALIGGWDAMSTRLAQLEQKIAELDEKVPAPKAGGGRSTTSPKTAPKPTKSPATSPKKPSSRRGA